MANKVSWLKINSDRNSLCETAKLKDLDFSRWELMFLGTLKVQEKKTSKFHLVVPRYPRPDVRLAIAGDLYWVIDIPDIHTGPNKTEKVT